MRRGRYIVLVFLIFALVIGESDGIRKNRETLSGSDGVDLHHEIKIDEEMAEQVWYYCRRELIGGMDGVEDLDLYLPDEAASESETVFPSKRNIHNVILVLPPHAKQTLLHCLAKKGSMFLTSEKSNSPNNWLINCFEWLLGTEMAPRRYLASDSSEKKTASPSPKKAPTAKRSSTPKKAPAKKNSPKEKGKASRSRKSAKKFKSSNGTGKRILIVVSSAVILVAVLLPFCCFWVRRRKSDNVGPKYAPPRDDKPLLFVSSADSSREFDAGGNAATNNGNQSSEAKSEANAGPPKIPIPLPPGRAAPPPSGPPPPPPSRPRPPPPPPPGVAPKPPGAAPKPPLKKNKEKDDNAGNDSEKTKLKPFFWDKVNPNLDRSMVWHELNAGSFQFNEDKIRSLFEYSPGNQIDPRKKDSASTEPVIQYIQILERKKAQNLSILLKALNITTAEVTDALEEGTELPVELLKNLLKMAPTSEEEFKLRAYDGEVALLGLAERFLKGIVEIPFAYKRMEALLVMCSFTEEVSYAKESFTTLEVACNTLRQSRLFLRILEAVLKTGNRMNDGTYRGGAMAFKLDTLLKLADVKGTDGKTTLMHFVVQEIIRYEGRKAARNARKSVQSMSDMNTQEVVREVGEDGEGSPEHYHNLGLKVVSGLSDELKDVKKAAVIDADGLTSTVASLGTNLRKARNFVETDLKNNLDEDCEFHRALVNFLEQSEGEVTFLVEEEKRIMSVVKSTADYFHGNSMKDEGLRLFTIVRDFLKILDRICDEIRTQEMKQRKINSRKESLAEASSKRQALAKSSSKKEASPSAPTDDSSENKDNVPTESSSEKNDMAATAELDSAEASSENTEQAAAAKEETSDIKRDSRNQSFDQDFGNRLFAAIAGMRIEDDFSSDEDEN